MRRNFCFIKVLLFTFCFLLFTLPVFAKKPKVYTPKDNYKYEWKVLRQAEKVKYEKSLMPESGFMERAKYEAISQDIPSKDREIPEYKLPKDIKMKYVPQPTYKLARYNDPPGSVELHIGRKFQYDRQFICPGITSPKKDILVYPRVSYYAANQCTVADLFVIPLDKTLPDVPRIQRANIIKRIPEPILSTSKDITEKFIFRTMTPIDFSPDGTKLLAKEKIGNVNDGIWQTNAWIYNFETKTAKQLPEIREAIDFYWRNSEGIVLEEKRWDIYPIGFSSDNPDRIVVSAYGYTGNTPKFLGTWSIDSNGEQTQLISLFKVDAPISVSGYKLVQDGIVDPATVYNDEKRENKKIKQNRKAEKKALKADKKKKKQAYKAKIKEMKREEREGLSKLRKPKSNSFYLDGN